MAAPDGAELLIRERALDDLALFSVLAPDDRARLAAGLVERTVPFGEVVSGPGIDPTFSVVLEGRARLLAVDEQGREVSLEVIGPGATFGEHVLFGSDDAGPIVRATSELRIAELAADDLARLVDAHTELAAGLARQARYRLIEGFLRSRSRLAALPSEVVVDLLDRLENVPIDPGDVLVREGDEAGAMFVVEAGKLVITRLLDAEPGARPEVIGFLRAGDVFGERAFLLGQRRFATVTAVTEGRLLRLPLAAVEELATAHVSFRRLIETLVDSYDHRRKAAIPLDFADELLPADAMPVPVTDATGPAAPPTDGASASTDTAIGDRAERVAEGVSDRADGSPRYADDPRRDGKVIRRFPVVRQVDEADCGAAALATVCRFYGRPISLGRARQAVRTGIDGTSLKGLVSGAESLGFDARAMKVSASNLDALALPAIAHWDGDHWLTVYRVDEDEVRVSDSGLRRFPREEFERRWSGYTLLLEPTDRLSELPKKHGRYGWLWPLAKPHWKVFAMAVVLALVVAGLGLFVPILTQVIVDQVLAPADLGPLPVIMAVIAAAILAMAGATMLQRWLLGRSAVRIDGEMLDHLTTRLLALPMQYFYERRVGDIQRRLVGLRQAREFAVQNGVRAIAAAAQLVAATALMLVYSPVLTAVFLSLVPVYIVLVRFATKRMRPMMDNLEESFGRYSSRQIDAIKGMETVKAMGAEDRLRGDLNTAFEGLAHRQFRVDFASMSYDGAVQVLSFVSLALFLWVGSVQVVHGAMSIGEFVSFNALVALSGASILTLMAIVDEVQYASVLVDRLEDIFDATPEQGADHSALKTVSSLEGRVTLDDVTFRYAPDAPAVLEGIHLDVAPGTTVAVVGRSGSGKSTLLKLLAGLVEPTEGTISYDAVPLPQLEHASLRSHVGFVLQDSYLFSDTIGANIAFGADTIEDERVVWAARMANAHDFVARLPLGYATRVGETGLLLSGGQRQRVCIARALYHRPPVLLLDEATSALDAESERAVRDNLDELLDGRTAFVIAHRMTTVREADLILVMDRGRIVERGTHDELIARRGLYFFLAGESLEE
jgi:ABC-type bacteriocin/lantibiotic exporter with double-glycine peptidase domain/CRP-like cAMP-binding protein